MLAFPWYMLAGRFFSFGKMVWVKVHDDVTSIVQLKPWKTALTPLQAVVPDGISPGVGGGVHRRGDVPDVHCVDCGG